MNATRTLSLPNSASSLAAGGFAGAGALSDADLARRSRLGDREAFAHLAERHEDAVFRLAWRILRHREDAEDAAQETFLRAWKALNQLDTQRDFRPWLMKIAVNTAISMAEKRSAALRGREDCDLDQAVPSVDFEHLPAAGLERRELIQAVEKLAAELPPEQAALFQLRYGEDLSLEEISRILDRPAGALAVALHRMRKHFRRALHSFHEVRQP